MDDPSRPSVFISYCHANPEISRWALELAENLTNQDIHAVIDVWDLKPGEDAHHFMERAVNDPEITKVVMVFDQEYKKRADSRTKGVGAETQIITKRIYETTPGGARENKFVGVVAELDGDGHPLTPAFYGSRIYIDMSDVSRYDREFDALVRWIYNEPMYKRPEYGRKPNFSGQTAAATGTALAARRAINALREGSAAGPGAVDEYLELVAGRLEVLADSEASPASDSDLKETYASALEASLPFRDEILSVLKTLTRFDRDPANHLPVRVLLERLVELGYPDRHALPWITDVYRSLTYELSLLYVSVLFRHESFAGLAALVVHEFIIPDSSYDRISRYPVLNRPLLFGDGRAHPLYPRSVSPAGNIISDRVEGTGVSLQDLVQSDFILYLRQNVDSAIKEHYFPRMIPFVRDESRPIPFFAKTRSERYQKALSDIFGMPYDTFVEKVRELAQSRHLPRFGMFDVRVDLLTGVAIS